jgi:hypothetical protein
MSPVLRPFQPYECFDSAAHPPHIARLPGGPGERPKRPAGAFDPRQLVLPWCIPPSAARTARGKPPPDCPRPAGSRPVQRCARSYAELHSIGLRGRSNRGARKTGRDRGCRVWLVSRRPYRHRHDPPIPRDARPDGHRHSTRRAQQHGTRLRRFATQRGGRPAGPVGRRHRRFKRALWNS